MNGMYKFCIFLFLSNEITSIILVSLNILIKNTQINIFMQDIPHFKNVFLFELMFSMLQQLTYRFMIDKILI